MPLYEYECQCGRVIDAFRPVSDRERPAICECGQSAPKRPFVRQSINPDLDPYFDDALTEPGGHGQWVLSRRQQREEMKRLGLANRRSYVGDF